MVRSKVVHRESDDALQPGSERLSVDHPQSHAWLLSLIVHLTLLIVFGLISIYPDPIPGTLQLTSTPLEAVDEAASAEDFFVLEEPTPEIGAGSLAGVDMALAAAPNLAEISTIPRPQLPAANVGRLIFEDPTEIATAPLINAERMVHGEAGIAETGAAGAVDRITHEILLSLQERPTLVVWLFDQSGSLVQQREMIGQRFQRIYRELDSIEQSGNVAFQQHADQRPLLTSIVAFGQQVSFRTKSPTADVETIKRTVAEIPLDDTGVERVFTAVEMAAHKYKVLRKKNSKTRAPTRNVMLVIVTDEAGDDPDRMDSAVSLCRNFAMPVYVIGMPAPFGRRETLVKWVDPDPAFDQRPQWAPVHQGPESLLPERLRLGSAGEDAAIDSGFGPYGLTRLAYESAGIYFSIHPQRDSRQRVRRRDTDAYAAYFAYFFEPSVMRRYQPDYVSVAEYRRTMQDRPMRQALVTAAKMSWLAEFGASRKRFVVRDEATLTRELSEAQKEAAKLEPKVNAVFQVLQRGEADRAREDVPRWQAGFDLAMGQIMRAKVRTESYNALLAQAKRGMKFKHQQHNTWVLQPNNQVTVGSNLERIAQSSQQYLQRVLQEHPDTPWALLAQRELARPSTWMWSEKFTDLNPPRPARRAANDRPSRDDQRRQLPRKTRRPVPKL